MSETAEDYVTTVDGQEIHTQHARKLCLRSEKH